MAVVKFIETCKPCRTVEKPNLPFSSIFECNKVFSTIVCVCARKNTPREGACIILMSLDIGCGFKNELDVNIDLNRNFKPTIVCDAHHMPFKPKVFDLINCSHLLEHLDKPRLCLMEINRVSKKGAKIMVGFPLEKNASNTRCYLRILLLNLFMPSLPFVILEIMKGLNKIRNKSYIVYHKWIITPEYVSKFLQVKKLERRGSYWQSLLVRKKARLLGSLTYALERIGSYHSYLLTCSPRQ